jgi:TonB dependent receptor/Carboxypeptidase regulatory-like domain
MATYRGTGRILSIVMLLGGVPLLAHAQLQTSLVSGRVTGLDGSAGQRAVVSLTDSLGHVITSTEADDEGRYRVRNVAPGDYLVRAEAPPLRSQARPVVVAGGLPVTVDLGLSPQGSEDVSVVADLEASGTTLSGEAVQRTGSRSRGGALRAAIADTPGWMSEDNGLMHYHGADDGILFVLDGVPVYERLDAQFGIGFDPLSVGSARVISGYVPAEFGLRSGGFVQVNSKAGEVSSWSGFAEMGAGGDRSQAVSGVLQGPLGGDASLTMNAGGERSRRFLDPVSLDNLHNAGSTGGGEARFVWAPGASVFTAHAGVARSSFEVPNDPEQNEAGQDQKQKLEQEFVTLNWQRSWSTATSSQVALFGRFTNAALAGSERDIPLFADGARTQDRLGLLAAVTHQSGRHQLKAGVEASRVRLDERFRFAVADPEEGEEAGFSDAVLAHGPDNPFDFSSETTRPIYSVYLQDAWRASTRVNVDLGLRYDHSRLLLSEGQLSPRAGISYRAGTATLRASVNRFFQPPQTEYLLLGSSPQARELSPFVDALGAGGADVRAERQTALELGANVLLPGHVRADVAVWRRWIRNQGDPNVFFGTSVIFPNSVDKGRAQGLDVRLELPQRGGFSGFVTYTLAKVEQYGPINGGLFLEDDIIDIGPGTRFTPDHDQRHALAAQLSYEDARRGLWLALGGRYRTGTPLEVSENELAGLVDRPGAELVDFDAERTKAYFLVDAHVGQRLLRGRGVELSARASVTNLTGTRYAFNFGNPFSGTHFGAPRTARVDLRLASR